MTENIKYLLPQVPYYKAALHTHTNISDGKLTPGEMKQAYKDRGFQIMCITDHNVIADHSNLTEQDFLMLTGVEVNSAVIPDWKVISSKTYHLLFIAKRPDNLWQPVVASGKRETARPYEALAQMEDMPRNPNVRDMNAMIARGNEMGFLCCYNHPVWSLQSYPDYAPLEGLWAMEICNYNSVINGYDEHNGRIYHEMCRLGMNIVPLGTDDAHMEKHITGAWTMIGAPELTYESVIRAMERGDLYASTGPEINGLWVQGQELCVCCTPAAKVALETSCRWARNVENKDGTAVTEARFDLSAWLEKTQDHPEAFLRITVTALDGSYAATRAYRRSELEALWNLTHKEKEF